MVPNKKMYGVLAHEKASVLGKVLTDKTDIYGVEHKRVRVISVLNNTFTGEDMDSHFNRVYSIDQLGNGYKRKPSRPFDRFNWQAASEMKLSDAEIAERKLEW